MVVQVYLLFSVCFGPSLSQYLFFWVGKQDKNIFILYWPLTTSYIYLSLSFIFYIGIYLENERKLSKLSTILIVTLSMLSFLYADEFSQPYRPTPLYIATSKVKHQIRQVAVYVLLAEAILGFATYITFTTFAHGQSIGTKALCGMTISLMYTGSLAFMYLIIES